MRNKNKQNQRLRVFSALEVANMCGVVNQTAINWIRNGILPAFNTPGGQYRVYRDDLIKFIRERGMRLPNALQDEATLSNNFGIIIIDDDTVFNEGLKSFILKQNMGLHVLQSFDGFDAGIQLVKETPSFVILDLGLPGVDGKEICRQLKQNEAFGSPFVIIVTGLDDTGLEEEMLALGADLFFKKPISFSEIISAIDKAK